MTVGELLTRMSSKEMREWQIYFQIEDSERKQAQSGGQTVAF